MHPLHQYLNKYASTLISEDDFEVIRSHFITKKVRKRQYFLTEGEICKYLGFIVKGAMRKYYLDEKGKEHVVNLYVENWWAGDRESFAMLTPSIYNVEALENCELLLITKENTLKLSIQSSAFNEFLLRLDEKNSIASQKRITSTISSSAKVRYDTFASSNPEFLQRFPQHLIASYLGISKDTLSRIRKQVVKK